MSRRGPVRSIALLAAMGLALAACGGDDADEEGSGSDNPGTTAEGSDTTATSEPEEELEPIEFNLASSETTNFTPLHVALELGMFAEHGLEPTMVNVAGGSELRAALQSGEVDVGITASTAQAVALAGGIDLRTFAISEGDATSNTYDIGAGIVAREDSGIDPDDPTTFIGKTVGAGFGGTVETYLRAYLDDHGIDQSQVNIINVPIPESVDALLNGLVDAVSTTEPNVTRAANEDGIVLVSQRAGYVRQIMTIGIPGPLAEENPELVRRFSAVMAEATHYVRNNLEEAAEIASNYIPGLDVDLALAVLEGATFDPRISVCTEDTFITEAINAFERGSIPVDVSEEDPVLEDFMAETEAEYPEYFEDLPPVPTAVEDC